MASTTIFPPILESKLPAFSVSDKKCIIPFSLSKFNGLAGFGAAHVKITKQSTGVSCVNTAYGSDGWYKVGDDEWRNGAAEIILDVPVYTNEDGDYFIILYDEDVATKRNQDLLVMNSDGILTSQKEIVQGFIPGWVYKIQIRLVDRTCGSYRQDYETRVSEKRSPLLPYAWLNQNSQYFSEWSTIGVIKATGQPNIICPGLSLAYPKIQEGNISTTNYIDEFNIFGEYGNEDSTEVLKSYRVRIYGREPVETDNGVEFDESYLLEDSKVQYQTAAIYIQGDPTMQAIETNSNLYTLTGDDGTSVGTKKYSYYDVFGENVKINGDIWWLNHFRYIPTYEPSPQEEYTFRLNFETINGLQFEVYKTLTMNSAVLINKTVIDLSPVKNADIVSESEEGRMGIKLFQPGTDLYSGNICIRRADQDDNFTVWHDIEIIQARYFDINNYDTIYDYTIESGKFYVYGVQDIDRDGNRGLLKKMSTPMMREFEYSYLLGDDGRQLKLMFDNTMDTFKINRYDTKVDTIGGRYPIITRNSAVDYRTFPIKGLISFWMDDENHLFYTREEAFNQKYTNDIGKIEISTFYDNYYDDQKNNKLHVNIDQYDYIWERKFREKVLEWLHDGKPKLFKSPTEGNIIVRLMDITCSPNNTLGRMIYSFSATAHEIAECNYNNLYKYGFIKPGTYATSFSVITTKIGQLTGTFNTLRNGSGDNIIERIYDKYDSDGRQMAGNVVKIKEIYGIKITIHDIPLRIKNNADDIVLGHNFRISSNDNSALITVYHPVNEYEFDTKLVYHINKNGAAVSPQLYFYPEEPLGEGTMAESVREQIRTMEADVAAYSILVDPTSEFQTLQNKKRRNMTREEWFKWKRLRAVYEEYRNRWATLRIANYELTQLNNTLSYILYGRTSTITATIDFLYKEEMQPYLGPRVKRQSAKYQLGQIYQRMECLFEDPYVTYNQDGMLVNGIRSELRSRYYLYLDLTRNSTDRTFSKLDRIEHAEIEANPGAVFGLLDDTDTLIEQHDMNDTGVLTLYNLTGVSNIKFLGYRMPDGSIKTKLEDNTPVWCDVIINYIVVVVSGEYRENDD